jgi:hypothetical protein
MAPVHHMDPAQPDQREYAYNLFRSKRLPEIICAVPEDRPVPGFIDAELWTFEQPLRPSDARPPCFHESAAQTGVRFNGFYLFYALAASPVVRSALEIVTGSV